MAKPEVELELININEADVPDIGMEDDDVERTEFAYSIRGPEDWVASGPLGPAGRGNGRHFETLEAAEAWAKSFYGARLKGRIPEAQREGANRWAFLIKGPRGEVN